MGNLIQFQGAVTGEEEGENGKKFYRARTMWMDRLNRRKDITANEYRVATYIAFRMNGVDQCSWPSQETIADDLGLSRETVNRITRSLKQKGVLTIEGGKTGTSNVYRMCGPV
jgi:DNA-binding MarR family transcriptional regulator